MYFDAGLKDHEVSYGVVIRNDLGDVIFETGGKLAGRQLTSNNAEFIALALGLTCAKALGIDDIEIFGDSQSVIKQVNRKCKTKTVVDQELLAIVDDLLLRFNYWTVQWISRTDNKEAHRASR